MNRIRIMLALVMACPILSLGAGRSELPARIALKDQSGAVDVLLTGRRSRTVHARLQDAATGSVTFDTADIKRMAVSIPEEALYQAEALAAAGRGQQALQLMREVVRPVLAYLDLPIDGALEPALRYAAIARGEKAWSEAISIYETMHENPDDSVRNQGIGWLAYCCMQNLEAKKAKNWLEMFEEGDPRDPGFVPYVLAGAMFHESEGDDEAALDLAARASALVRIDHELYVEALKMSADAYYRMSQKEVPEEGSDEVVLRRNPDVETPLPPMLPEEFLAAATNQYARIALLFPSSPYAESASNTLAAIEATMNQESESGPMTGNGEAP